VPIFSPQQQSVNHILHHAFVINEKMIRLLGKAIAFANIIKIEEKRKCGIG
jgi:hypothetical protein